jgi:hypothetical protein
LEEFVLFCKEKENKKYGLTGQNLGKMAFDRKFVIRTFMVPPQFSIKTTIFICVKNPAFH